MRIHSDNIAKEEKERVGKSEHWINRRWFFYFSGDRSINFEISSYQHFGLSFEVSGDEGHVQFGFWFLFSFWVTFEGFIPDSWYPKEWNSCAKKYLNSAHREIALCFHHWTVWLYLWTDPNSWTKGDRSYNFDIRNFFIGDREYKSEQITQENFILPFYEGNYSIWVRKNKINLKRKRRWLWFLDKSGIRYEVEAGYYEKDEYGKINGNRDENTKFISTPIPHEGKGESAWDCGESSTSSITFGMNHVDIRSCSDAAIEFWKSNMQTRIRYGGKKWLPQKYENLKVEDNIILAA